MPVHAEGRNSRAPKYCWDGNPARPPKSGEHYLSGAKPVAYRAPHDLTTPFFIAVPVHETITPGQLRSDTKALHELALSLSATTLPAHRLRILATRARQLADDADALATHLAQGDLICTA